MLRAAENRRSLCARPLEGLLDLGAGRVRQFGGLVARLLEEAAALRLCLLQLARRIGVRLREQLARLVTRRVQHLPALALALQPVALDLGFAVLEVGLAAANLFLSLPELRRGRRLCVALDRVRELGGGADQVQRVHPCRMARGLDRRRPPGCLQHAKLGLQLRGMAPERVEGLAHPLGIESVTRARQILELRQRRQRRGVCPTRALGCHFRFASLSTRRCAARAARSMTSSSVVSCLRLIVRFDNGPDP